MLRYFLYVRKSTESEERQVLSIEAQISECRQFADKENLKIVIYSPNQRLLRKSEGLSLTG